MADNIDVTAGTGTTIATDQVGTAHFQKVKLVDGTAESTTVIAAGGGVEAGALRVTLASDGTGVVSVDDNGSSLTVDGSVTASLAAGTNNIGDVDVLSIAAGDNNIGNFDVVTMPVGGYCASSDLTSACTTDITTATATEVLAAPGSGKYFHLTSVLVTNGDADTGTFVNLYDTTDGTGTVKWTGYAASAGGGFSVSLPAPINWGDNKPVWAKCESSDATVRVSIAGFIK